MVLGGERIRGLEMGEGRGREGWEWEGGRRRDREGDKFREEWVVE